MTSDARGAGVSVGWVSVGLHRLLDIPPWRDRAVELDAIFFEASLTKSFADDTAREAFRERWLGRFLDRWPELAHVAIGADGEIIGYIVGAHDDPARDPVFADIGFYRKLEPWTARFPAHLHINLAPAARGLGIGTRLIEAFVADACAAGCAGVHLVTGRNSRNRSFYARNGFACLTELEWGRTPIVMLGRACADGRCKERDVRRPPARLEPVSEPGT